MYINPNSDFSLNIDYHSFLVIMIFISVLKELTFGLLSFNLLYPLHVFMPFVSYLISSVIFLFIVIIITFTFLWAAFTGFLF